MFLESSFSGSLFVYFAMKIINEEDVKGIMEVSLVSCSDFFVGGQSFCIMRLMMVRRKHIQ